MGVFLPDAVQFKSSLDEINSVGLNSGFLAALRVLSLSSNFWDTVERIVLAGGISISSVGRLPLVAIVVGGRDGVEVLDEVVAVDEIDVEEQQLSESESELLSVVISDAV